MHGVTTEIKKNFEFLLQNIDISALGLSPHAFMAIVDVKMVFLLVLATYDERGSYCLHLQSGSVWLAAVTGHHISFNFITHCSVKNENCEPVYFAALKKILT